MKTTSKNVVAVNSAAVEPIASIGALHRGSDPRFWRWGDDNMFPYALALMSRRSTTHRRIINDKADYISGKGFSFDPECGALAAMVEAVNGGGESMRQLINKLAFDKCLLGNAFVEVVTDRKHTFLSLYHQDATRCRLSKDRRSVLLHHDWHNFRREEAQSLPLWPAMAECADGTLRSIVHYRDYEPMFENYGVPPYIAGMNVSAIAYKTDKWNISRLDNSFQLSGVMVLDGTVESEAEAEELKKLAKEQFAGKPGQVMFILKDCNEQDNSKFIPINSASDGDWRSLHEQATGDIVVAHSWFRSLSGLEYGSGFSSDRILHEYEVALNTVILAEQEELMEPLRGVIAQITGVDCRSLQIVNRPPARSKPLYMRIWEARKAEGLDYDPDDAEQQLFVAQITKYALKNID
jgi:hypothetical protein